MIPISITIIFTIGAISAFSTARAIETPPSCTLYFIRGNGEAVMRRAQSLQKSYPGINTLGLGCYIETEADSMPTAKPIHQLGGSRMNGFQKDYNGGFIRRLTNSTNLSDDVAYLFELSKQTKDPNRTPSQFVSDWVSETQAVGFEKIQSERWQRGLAHAVSEVDRKKCKEFQIRVDCPSSDNSDDTYAERLKLATETKIVHQATKKPIRFQTQICGTDISGQYRIQNIPKSCGDIFTIDLRSARSLASGACKKQIKYYQQFDERNTSPVEATQQPIPQSMLRDKAPPQHAPAE